MSEQHNDKPTSKPIDQMTHKELDDFLDDMAGLIDRALQTRLGHHVGFILLLGSQAGYRGTVTNLTAGMPKIAEELRRTADFIDKGQSEW